MPAGRRILPQWISTDPRFSRVSLKAKVLYPLLWVNGDDQGRLSGDPDKIKLAVCAAVPEITSAEVPELIENLHNENLIISYNTKQRAAVQITDWWEAQRPQWAYPSEYDPPPGWRDKLRYKERPTGPIITVNWESKFRTHSDQLEPESEEEGKLPPGTPASLSASKPPGTPAGNKDNPHEEKPEEEPPGRPAGVPGNKKKKNSNANPNSTQTQTSLRASEARAQHTTLKLDYYDKLQKASKPQQTKKVLVSFLQAELRQGDNNNLYPQVGKMLNLIENPFQLMSVMLSVRDRDQLEPLVDVMSFLWSMVNETAAVDAWEPGLK